MEQDKHSKLPIRLDEIRKDNGFAVPENYFSSLQNDLVPNNIWESASKNTPFQVPDGYFDRLPTLIQQKIAPKGVFDWSNVWKEGFYSIPKGYFDELPMRIATRLKKKKSVQWDWKLILALLSPRFSVPLAVGCLMIGYVLVQVFDRRTDTSMGLNEINNEVIHEYLMDNQLVHDEQVAERVSMSKIKELESIVPSSVTKEELEENMDLSSLDESSI